MGMAASQARLLAITARMHDVEYQAQAIQNAKLQLSVQSDQVYNDYLEALDATTLTINTIGNDGQKSVITANFNNLFSINRVRPADGSQYALRNEKGQLVVEKDVYEAYNKFKYNDAFAFAAFMLGGNANKQGSTENGEYINNVHKFEEQVYKKHSAEDYDEKDGRISKDSELANLRKALEEYVSDGNIYSGNLKNDKDKENYNNTLNRYRELLYKQFGEEICTTQPDKTSENASDPLTTKDEFDLDKFDYYVSIFNQIRLYGGCVPISDYNGMFGDAANNSDWLKSMIECGKFSIEIIKSDKNGKLTTNGTSPSSDTSLSYTTTTSIDNTALKKAEAKYEKSLKDIDKKDKQYDLTLSKLETEREALDTERDSIKKVIQDNIERTFGIFS